MHIKLKYRLLFVIILPTIVLLAFLFTFLQREYQYIHKGDDVQMVMALTGELMKLDILVLNEGNLTRLHLHHNKSELSKEIYAERQRVDKQIAVVKEFIETKTHSYDGKLKEHFHSYLFQIEQLQKKRMQADSKSNGSEVFDYYESLRETIDSTINIIVDQVVHFPMTQRLYELLIVSQEQMAAGRITNLVLDALYQEKMSSEHYINLLKEIGRRDAAREIYYDVAIPEEEAAYRQNMKSDVVNSSMQMLDKVIAMGMTGPYEIQPQVWMKNRSARLDQFDDDIDHILNFNQKDLDAIKSDYKATLIKTIVITALVLAIALYLVLNRLKKLAKDLEHEVQVLSISGEEILRSISEASSGMVETATAVTETTTTVEELKQTAQVATEKAKNVADVSSDALTTLKSSEATIADTIQWMNRIHDGMGTISESIMKLSEHGKMIGDIIDVVNDLAEQSHLLAVNAAIEAAKAGDQGKGFAVVAQEVRSLADQSKQATVQVRNILNDIQNATNAAVMATEQGSKAVNHGLTQSTQTNESVRSLSLGINNVAQAAAQISLSSQQQLVGVNQVTIAMSNIKVASDQQVDHMRQIEGGVQGMNTVGKSLKDQVTEFKI